MWKMGKKYEVVYYTLEPSYYEHSEKHYVRQTFNVFEEALAFVEDSKKFYPAQIIIKALTEEILLDLRDIDDYKENRIGLND
jgi:hypothetical protein